MASLVDTNVLVYSFDSRDPVKQRRAEYPVLYPTREVFLTALRGTATYGLSWFDAYLWAYAEMYGVEKILSEDFTHGRHYGNVRAVNPFLAADGVHELPPLYAATQEAERPTTRPSRVAAPRRRSHSARTRP